MKQVVWNSLNDREKYELLKRPAFTSAASLQDDVLNIIDKVRLEKDKALYYFAKKFDGLELNSLKISQNEEKGLKIEVCDAINIAYENIKKFHAGQGLKPYKVETMPGVRCHREIRPYKVVGIYVPGGTAPLVSTTLMLGIPAQLAGCAQVVLCTPCGKDGVVNPYILYAASLCGIRNIFCIGGAQAIAAMAYGTDTVPKVEKIYGPGNAYVTEAKIQVSKDPNGAAIDIPAGPSEVCVIADDNSNAEFIAADLLSQAEHDINSQVILICLSKEFSNKVQSEIDKQIKILSRRTIAAQAIENSLIVICSDIDEAISISNIYAPEHLIMAFEDAETYIDKVQNAGSVFLGPWTPESAGDYASGTNHVLPTYGYARNYSGLTVEAFQKTITVQNITKAGLNAIGSAVTTLANIEGLDAHARAITIRMESLNEHS